MNRFLALATLVFICSALALPAGADDPPKKLTTEERKELEAKWKELNDAGLKAYRSGNYPDAITSFEESLKVARRLYNATEFPDGHGNLGVSLNYLAGLNLAQGKLAAVEPFVKEALEIYRRLYKGEDDSEIALSLNTLASLYQAQGKLGDAEMLFKDSLEMRKRLFRGQDDPDLALGLNNLAALYKDQGKLVAAEPLYKDALEMLKRLLEGQDHPNVAKSLNNLAALYKDQGKLAAAEPLFKDSLEMRKRLFKGQDHPDLANGLNNLASLFHDQGRLGDAEMLFKDSLEMRKRLFKGQDHPSLANGLNNLAALYKDQAKLDTAERLFKDALEMNKRLFKGQDHPEIADSLNNLAMLYKDQGKLGDAEPLFKDALEMKKRLFKGQDNSNLANSLNNLATLYHAQGKLVAAESLYKDALEMFRRLATVFAQNKTEGDTLTLLVQQPLTRDGYLSTARRSDPAAVYAQVWADKGYIARAYEGRLLQTRAVATGPKAVRALADLTDARRRRAELLRAPATKDPATLVQRKQDITTYEDRIEKMTRDLKVLLPASVRADKFATAPYDLQKVQPADAAVVDFLRFVHREHDKDKPGAARTPRYLAFVVTKEKVAWVDLDTAVKIEAVVNAWRVELTSGKDLSRDVAAKVRELIWEKVRKELPATIKTVYVCPDAMLCQVPFAALPGDKPGTILLEDFAVAMIPHAPFLLDKLWPQDTIKNPPTNALIVSGVKYDAALPPRSPDAATRRGDPLLNPDAKPFWSSLGNTVGEANGVAATAVRRNLPVVRFDGDKATTESLLKALPKSKYAHFATHGFFGDPRFHPAFHEKEKDTLVGKWEVVESNDGPPAGSLFEFKSDGSLTVTINANGKSTTVELTYKHEGEKIPYRDKAGDWVKPNVEAIKELTADKLVTANDVGKKTEFKKKENRGGERGDKAALSPLVMTGLVFAGANNEKTPGRGIISGELLIDLDLSGLELAVLSACATGLGDAAGGQGTFGLQRAFHYAGATNVVCSLWKTPDESTAALMNLFYTNLWDKNLSPMESLRQAQLDVYRNPSKIAEWAKGFRGTFEPVSGAGGEIEIRPTKDGTAHPTYWAAFTLSGPGR